MQESETLRKTRLVSSREKNQIILIQNSLNSYPGNSFQHLE